MGKTCANQGRAGRAGAWRPRRMVRNIFFTSPLVYRRRGRKKALNFVSPTAYGYETNALLLTRRQAKPLFHFCLPIIAWVFLKVKFIFEARMDKARRKRPDETGCSVSNKSTRCQENECFIFLNCIIFLCRPSKGLALRRVRSANFQFAVASRANALPSFVTFGDGRSEAAFTRLEVRGRPKGPRRTGTPTRRSRGWGEKENDRGSGHLGRSSNRQSRFCGLDMKGPRPLHTSPEQ